MSIPEHILESFDIAGLQERMNNADWFYDYSDDSYVWNAGLHQINGIKKQLEELCKLKGGKEIAILLWDTYVPQFSVNKPDFLTLKDKVMNEKNLEHLQKDLKYLGFGDGLNEELEKNISAKKSDFTIQMLVEYNGRQMTTDLSFKAGKENDMYFFNSYRATMQDHPELTQQFYIDKGKGITTKEAFNLLEGRAVNKDLTNREGEQYNAWLQLNFKETEENGNYKTNRYHENYNYDLPQAVGQLVLKPMSPNEEDKLLNSLEKGNMQSVTFLREGEEVKGFIEANPKDRTIDIYDGKMNKLSKEQKEDLMDLPPAGKDKSQSARQGAGDDGGGGDDTDPALKKKRTRKQGNGQSV